MTSLPKSTAATAFVLRLAMAATFLSAVGSRFGLWGSGWRSFVAYTAEVNSFVPHTWAPMLAIAATALELTFAALLLIGLRTQRAALGASVLTLGFALAMAWSFGLKSPMDYSVFVDSAAMGLLSTLPPDRWTVDAWLERRAVRQAT